MNFKEMRERADNLDFGGDAIRDLRRALEALDSAIDEVRDAYSDIDSALDDLNTSEVEEFLGEVAAMEEPTLEAIDPIENGAWVWRIAGALLLASGSVDIDIIHAQNKPVFWAAVSVALLNYPPNRTIPLNNWLSNTFPTGARA